MAFMTLIEAAKEMENDFQSAIVDTFARQHPLLTVLPFDDIVGPASAFNREGTLPDVGFRSVNAGYTAHAGTLEPVVEPLMLVGGDLDVDKFIVKTGGPGMRTRREKMKLKHLAHFFAHKVIKGSHSSDVREFDGLQLRCLGDRRLDNKVSSPTDGGDPLSLARLDALLAAVPGVTHLIASSDMVGLLTAAARVSTVAGNINFSVNEFGHRITTYNRIPIIEIGGTGQVYASLGFTEVGSTGTTATATSIYAVRIDDDGFHGIQAAPPDVADLGEIDAQPVLRTRMDWYPSIRIMDKNAVARLRGISNAAVIA